MTDDDVKNLAVRIERTRPPLHHTLEPPEHVTADAVLAYRDGQWVPVPVAHNGYTTVDRRKVH